MNNFGYGKLMSMIAELKDGTFFFKRKLDMVVEGLGSILKTVGQNSKLIVSSKSSEIVPNINLSKGIGGDNLWVSNNKIWICH